MESVVIPVSQASAVFTFQIFGIKLPHVWANGSAARARTQYMMRHKHQQEALNGVFLAPCGIVASFDRSSPIYIVSNLVESAKIN